VYITAETDSSNRLQLIVEANNIAADIDDEIGVVHKFAKDKYSKRFPELETLVVNPLDYLLTAKELQNHVCNESFLLTTKEMHFINLVQPGVGKNGNETIAICL
jgi:RNA processing factor Prp31